MTFDIEQVLLIFWLAPGVWLFIVANIHDISRKVFSLKSVFMTTLLCSVPIINIIVLSRVNRVIKSRAGDKK